MTDLDGLRAAARTIVDDIAVKAAYRLYHQARGGSDLTTAMKRIEVVFAGDCDVGA